MATTAAMMVMATENAGKPSTASWTRPFSEFFCLVLMSSRASENATAENPMLKITAQNMEEIHMSAKSPDFPANRRIGMQRTAYAAIPIRSDVLLIAS